MIATERGVAGPPNGPFRRCSVCAEWESRRGPGRWYGGGDSGRTQGARDRHDHGLRLQKQKVWAAAIQVRDHREQQKQTQEGHSWPLPEWRAPTE